MKIDNALGKLLKKQKTKCSPKWSQFFLEEILAAVPQRPALGQLFFLIYINDLSNDVSSICEMFANKTPLPSKVKDSSVWKKVKYKKS